VTVPENHSVPVWIGSDTRSYDLLGPGTISYSTSQTATSTSTYSGSVTAEEGIIFASLKEQYSYSFAHAVATTQTWNYSINVPSGVNEHARVYQKGIYP
jgi:hypothetical protein